MLAACVAAPRETSPPIEISLRPVGAGGQIWLLCPGCAPADTPPLLRPLRNLKRKGNYLWELSEDFFYVYGPTCDVIVVPSGFVTDLASIPAVARVRHNPANYAEAAVVHDWLYSIGEANKREKADDVFREALNETGHGDFATELYRAVRFGGARGYGLPDDFAFWIKESNSLDKSRPKPATGFTPLNQLLDAGNSKTLAERFGALLKGSPPEDTAELRAYFAGLCAPKQGQ